MATTNELTESFQQNWFRSGFGPQMGAEAIARGAGYLRGDTRKTMQGMNWVFLHGEELPLEMRVHQLTHCKKGSYAPLLALRRVY